VPLCAFESLKLLDSAPCHGIIGRGRQVLPDGNNQPELREKLRGTDGLRIESRVAHVPVLRKPIDANALADF
jgi:hypothetical protein